MAVHRFLLYAGEKEIQRMAINGNMPNNFPKEGVIADVERNW